MSIKCNFSFILPSNITSKDFFFFNFRLGDDMCIRLLGSVLMLYVSGDVNDYFLLIFVSGI